MDTLFFITRALTFFGSALRCFWEFLVCRLFKLPIEDARCFKMGEMCSHIEHELAEKTSHAFFLCFLPFILNLCLGTCFLLFSSYFIFYAGAVSLTNVVMLIIGISLYSNLFPSVENALSLKDHVNSANSNTAKKVFLLPFTYLMLIGAFLEKYSITVLTSIITAIAFPFITDPIVGLLAKIIMGIKV